MSSTTYVKENENVKENINNNSNTGTTENESGNGSALSKEAQETLNYMREQTAQADAAKMAFERRFMPEDSHTYRRIVDLNSIKLVDDRYKPGRKKFCFVMLDPQSFDKEEDWPVGPAVFRQFDQKFKRHNMTKGVFDITRHGAAGSTSTTYEIDLVEKIS